MLLSRRLASSLLSGLLFHLLPTLTLAAPNCPIQGPNFPKPKHPSANEAVKAAVANLTASFNALAAGTAVVATNVSWSMEVYSVTQPELIFSHYHTQKNLNQTGSLGVSKVDSDTVYRLGSLTKVITVLNWFANDGDIKWTTPITEFVPELREIQASREKDPVKYVDWDTVTVGALLGQMSGLPRDYTLLGELTQEYRNDELVWAGFPKLPESEISKCGSWPVCNRTEFFDALRRGFPYPTIPADATPAYSNIAYQILGYALENIKGKSWFDTLDEKVLKPLNLKRTFYFTPNTTEPLGVIAGNYTETGWWSQLGDESPAGSMYASSGDLTTIGRAIMNSTLLRQDITNRWLKPTAFTSDPNAGLGAPWGVRRINLDGHPYRWTYGYQKAGRIGDYAGLMILLPDLDIGMSIMMAGDMPYNFNFDCADAIGAQLVPAVDAAAKAEAEATYAGRYVAASAAGTASALNSSMVVVRDGRPGLGVRTWYSNGTDMNTLMVRLQLQTFVGPVVPTVRLYPTGLETVRADGTRTVSFKATYEDENSPARTGVMFSTDCATWLSMTSYQYGSAPIDEVVFHFGADGKVESVEPLALRLPMSKVS